MEARLVNKHGHKEHVCPRHDLSEDATSPLFGLTSFHRFNEILSGSCAAFVLVVVFLHLFSHAIRLSNPSEQLKIMRISFLLPIYSVFSFLSICFPSAKVYIMPWVDVFQAHSVCAFFLLMCDYISPLSDRRNDFFAALHIPNKKSADTKTDGLVWFRRSWIFIFQYPVVAVATAIATDVTEALGVYCQYESKAYFAKLWIGIFRNISLTLAVISVLRFTVILKSHLAEHKPMAKLVSFKLIVLLSFIQTIVFWILDDAGALKTTNTMSYADLHMGIPSLISCLEMVPISLLLAWAYTVRPYLIGRQLSTDLTESQGRQDYPRSYQGGPLGIWAFLAMFDPMEILKGIGFAFKLATSGKNSAAEPEFRPVGDETHRRRRRRDRH